MSYIVTDRSTGEAVIELWSANVAAKVNLKRYKVWEAGDYLKKLNLAIQVGKFFEKLRP